MTKFSGCANVCLDAVIEEIEQMTKKQILDRHKYKIYFSDCEQCWRSYLPDNAKRNNRKPIKRKKKEDLENLIVQFYKNLDKENDRSQITLENLFKEWMIYRRDYTPVKPKTLQEGMYEWKHFFADTDLSKMRVKDITPLILTRFFRKVTKNRTEQRKRVSNARSLLNGMFYYAIEEEIVVHNPVSDVNFKSFVYKPVEDQSENVFTQEDIRKLLIYLKPIVDPYSLAIQLSFYLFIRIGETKAIRIEDIDFEKNTLYLHNQVLSERTLNDDLTFSKREVVVSTQMKGNTSRGYRRQHLTPQAVEIIKKAIQLNPDGTFLFEPNGKCMTTDRFNRRLKKYCESCGIPYHSSHKIRFYNASVAYDGTNLSAISRLMGHSELQTTIHYLRNVHKDNKEILAFDSLGIKDEQSVQECSKIS